MVLLHILSVGQCFNAHDYFGRRAIAYTRTRSRTHACKQSHIQPQTSSFVILASVVCPQDAFNVTESTGEKKMLVLTFDHPIFYVQPAALDKGGC